MLGLVLVGVVVLELECSWVESVAVALLIAGEELVRLVGRELMGAKGRRRGIEAS